MDIEQIPTFIVDRIMVARRWEQNWGFSKFNFPYMYITVIRLNCNDDLYNETWYQQKKVETTRNLSWCPILSLKKSQLLITLQLEANFSFSDFNLSKKLFYATSSYQIYEYSCNFSNTTSYYQTINLIQILEWFA